MNKIKEILSSLKTYIKSDEFKHNAKLFLMCAVFTITFVGIILTTLVSLCYLLIPLIYS